MECKLSAFLDQQDCYPWVEGQSPITREEIAAALDRPNELIAPGLFVDTVADSGERDNFGATRAEHVKRIGWFVLNWDLSPDDALTARENCGGGLSNITDGNHRYLAAWYREEDSIFVKLEDGCKSTVEGLTSFVRWIEPPASALRFGVSIVSTANDACEFLWDGDRRFWLNDGVTGMSLATLREGMLLQRYRRNLEPVGGLMTGEATRDNLVDFMLDEYHPFQPYREQINDSVVALVMP